MKILKQIKEAITRHNLIPKGKHVVVGVSGGADSIALLRNFQALEIPFTVAHMNHQLRGAESDADEAFVRALGFPTVVKSVDVCALAKSTGQSIEMAARQARHEFFAEFNDAVIALAHHANDQAETFMIKLARGAGTEGLNGMPYRQELGNLQLIRPMLQVPRSAILLWLKENNIAWREDSSNADPRFLRNKVRHQIIPLLQKELNPRFDEAVLRTMEILRAENEWMNEMVATAQLPASNLPLAARRRVVRNWLFDQGAESAPFELVEQILTQLDAGTGTRVVELNSQQRVVIEYGMPRFEHTPPNRQATIWSLSTEPGTGWRIDDSKIGEFPARASLSAQQIGNSAVHVRTWQPGDRMAPLGMTGSRKIQDILTDLKVPKEQRNEIPVVLCREEIVWLPGYRIARDWRLKSNTEKAIQLKLERNRTE